MGPDAAAACATYTAAGVPCVPAFRGTWLACAGFFTGSDQATLAIPGIQADFDPGKTDLGE